MSDSKNRSYAKELSFSGVSDSEEHLNVLDADVIDPAFQLSTGNNGDIIPSQFWMCELQAQAKGTEQDGATVG